MTRRSDIRLLAATALCVLAVAIGEASAQPDPHGRDDAPRDAVLRIATINMWSGLDYIGATSVGEWESGDRRDRRFAALVEGLRGVDPDIVLLQEGSPIGSVASRLAEELGFDEIHQVVNAGVKLGPLGIPWNLKEGIAILARPALRLEEARTWKLSGSPGLHGGALSLHFDEAVFALVGRVRVGDRPLHIVNVHLSAAPLLDRSLRSELATLREAGEITADEERRGLADVERAQSRRAEEIAELSSLLDELDPRIATIVAGDFNTTLESGELAPLLDSGRYRSALSTATSARPTWDALANENVGYSLRLADARGRRLEPAGIVAAVFDRRRRAIDHILLGAHFDREASDGGRIILDHADTSAGTPHASDHYGVAADIDLRAIDPLALRESDERIAPGEPRVDALPIVSYDTDAGFGYGAKGYLRNMLGGAESFDITLFNSTEGERWYRLVAAWPDGELRHHKTYPIAFDLEIDYDKWIANSFFGIGPDSRYDDRRVYTREPLDAALIASTGLSTELVAQMGVRLRTVRNHGLADSLWSAMPVASMEGRETWGSLVAGLRYDTRNSTVEPSRGVLVQLDVEHAPGLIGDNHLTKLSASTTAFLRLWHPTTVLALRVAARGIIGPDVPIHALLSLGGNNTLRGSPQDRYLDRIVTLANAELRFPIVWRFGAVVGLDAGRVFGELDDVGLARWPSNPVAGLRFSMETFVARLDIGFGRETTGMYFNFGHAF